jgi:hypothetical protein
MAAKKTGKGNEGSKGKAARAAIRKAEGKGFTLTQIARSVSRSPGTISDIKTGDIENPPNDLTKRIRTFANKPAPKKKKTARKRRK